MMKTFLLFIFLMSGHALANSQAEVVILKGSVTYQGRALKSNDVLKGQGEVQAGEKSYVKLKLAAGHTIIIGASSSMSLDLDKAQEGQKVNLIRGIGRWITGGPLEKNSQAGIKTRNAVFGVRGTDFMVSYNELLGETEIVCFDGRVEFTNVRNKADNKSIKKNQWGGLGGRFGSRIGEVLDLPPAVITHFNGSIPVL